MRLGLVSLAYLWQREQHQLLREMLFNGMDAVLVKVASAGLNTKHLGQSLADLHSYLDTVVRWCTPCEARLPLHASTVSLLHRRTSSTG